MRVPYAHVQRLIALFVVLCVPAAAAFGQVQADEAVALDDTGLPAADAFSPAFLGMYRKTMEIDASIARFSRKYGVDPRLARAVCMFESGGNRDLTSGPGAHGYFQVMPSTFRLMHVATNIEAGIKYLSQLIKQFGREDYALAAYNGGPGRVARGRAMPLESLQYVIGVGYYRSVLKMYEPAVRAHASTLRLVRSRAGDDWPSLSDRLDVPVVQLRLYNPFVTDWRLRRGTFLIAYPAGPVADLLEAADDGRRHYRARIGDNYINLAFALGVDVDQLREANGLWRLQVLPADMMLTIPSGEGAPALLDPRPATRAVERASDVEPASAPPARRAAAASRPHVHRVQRGETLTAIARRYGTTVGMIQRANGFGRRATIRTGERLIIPGS